jgi:hypothetical protein
MGDDEFDNLSLFSFSPKIRRNRYDKESSRKSGDAQMLMIFEREFAATADGLFGFQHSSY